jgi:hypothetical protein
MKEKALHFLRFSLNLDEASPEYGTQGRETRRKQTQSNGQALQCRQKDARKAG